MRTQMIERLVSASVCAAVLFALGAPPAEAANTTCANASTVPAGEVVSDIISDTQDAYYRVKLKGGHSYVFLAWSSATDPSIDGGADLEMSLIAACTGPSIIPFSSSNPFDDYGSATHNGETNVHLPAETGQFVIHVFDGDSAPTGYTVQFLFVETTLVAPFFQVATAAGYDSAPQIVNSDNQSHDVTVTHFSATGAVICENTFVVPANNLRTYAVSGPPPGCSTASAFGWIRVAHDGPPGGIVLNVTTFSGTSGLSFDAPGFRIMELASTH